MRQDLELLSIGDAALDVFLAPSESESLCMLDNKECLICFSYGEKIPVKNIEFSLGGNAANNVVGATRLGVKAGIVTTLGGDPTGNQIVEKLKKEGVDISFLVQQPMAVTNYSTVVNYGGERTIFTYHAPRSYEFPANFPVVPWFYLTSMGETFTPFYNHLVDFLNQHRTEKIKLAFNPGSWQMRKGVPALKPVLEATYMIYVNREEAENLTAMDNSRNREKDLLESLSALGPKVCVVTDGANGSYVFDSETNKFYRGGVLPVDAYERTGAGDAFGAGCISALIKGKNFPEAILWGIVNSASVIGYVGSQRGLLRENEIPQWLERAKSSGVQVVEI